MTDVKETPEATEATETKTSLVNVKRENYQDSRTAKGGKSLNNGDFVATMIEGLENDELYSISEKFLAFPLKVKGNKVENVDGLKAAYADLNTGMQRMNLGNRFRSRVHAIDAENEKIVETAKKEDKEPPKSMKSGEDKLTAVASPFVKARDARVKKAEAEAAKAAKEKAAKEKKADAA